MTTIEKIPRRIRLSFNEANILIINIRDLNHGAFIARLDTLIHNTSDPKLLSELESLITKVTSLSSREFEQLRLDIVEKKVLFHPEYVLPTI